MDTNTEARLIGRLTPNRMGIMRNVTCLSWLMLQLPLSPPQAGDLIVAQGEPEASPGYRASMVQSPPEAGE